MIVWRFYTGILVLQQDRFVALADGSLIWHLYYCSFGIKNSKLCNFINYYEMEKAPGMNAEVTLPS